MSPDGFLLIEQAEASMKSFCCLLVQVLPGALLPVKLAPSSGGELLVAGWNSAGGACFPGQQAAGACRRSPSNLVSSRDSLPDLSRSGSSG